MATGTKPPKPADLLAALEGAADPAAPLAADPDCDEPEPDPAPDPDPDPDPTAEKDWLVGVTACPV